VASHGGLGQREERVGLARANDEAGGAKIDTNGFAVGLNVPLTEDALSTGGGLTKLGAGTLTLGGGANTYTGATSVEEGILSITDADSLSDTAALSIALGAVLDLNFAGIDTVTGLYLDGVSQATGTWGATGSGATNIDDTYFTGSGLIEVLLAALIPGDANNDGLVNDVDSKTLAGNWGMTGASWADGDFDGDGLVDLLVPDMRYGCLYRNTGDGNFEEKSAEAGLAAVLGQYTSWSGNFFDFDNDGMLDIFIVNGDAHHLEPEEDILFRGVGGGRFADVSSSSGAALETKGMGRGSAVGDIDNDGDLDLLVLNLNGPARLLRNDGGNRGNWLMVRTVGTKSNRDGIGARVRLTTGGVTQVRDIRSSSGYLSQSDPRAHFGLGSARTVDRVEIRWPSGRVSTIENVKVDQVLTITEPDVAAK